MSRYRRVRLEGGAFFFTVVTYQRQPILNTPLGVDCLRKAWRETVATMPFQVEAVCVLPDHLHTVWFLPEKDDDYSTRWKKIKGVFSCDFRRKGGRSIAPNQSRKARREVGIWQRRYWEHRIRDPDGFRRHVEYTHFNPVKHRYVTSVSDWPFSSFHDHVKKGWVESDWGTVEPELIAELEAGE